uniref:Uncharacterized protein n=1 Tax=Arundo donax TaxID=35708 RepID=A0A0A9F1M9_ARUDO
MSMLNTGVRASELMAALYRTARRASQACTCSLPSLTPLSKDSKITSGSTLS